MNKSGITVRIGKAMIFAAGGLTSMFSSVLMGRAVITDAEQLRPVTASSEP